MMLINLFGLLLIAFIIWWFWIYKPKAVSIDSNIIKVVVDNGIYQPSRIQLPMGQSVTLQFLRKDASPCAATVVFADLDISEDLPLNQAKDITLPPLTSGEYPFSCQMQMYRGTLVVNDKQQ